jgi:hypothetical protein
MLPNVPPPAVCNHLPKENTMSAVSEPPETVGAVRAADVVPSANGATAAEPEARASTTPAPLHSVLSIPSDFRFNEVPAVRTAGLASNPPLGPLAAFKGTFAGNGFNTIFRPDNPITPTPLPVPVPGSDNILELNLTHETLSFSAPLGAVPNRGFVQGDAMLNGVPYLQSISDITTGQSIGIHFEPGLWVIVPPTKDPDEGSTLVRMASIPHGTTINAQGTFRTFNGPPTIGAVNITPSFEGGSPNTIRFASQTAATGGTPRIPQDLAPFIAAGTITQAILDDPNTLLRNHLSGLDITQTTVISISTSPTLPLFGGGTDNIAFLWGDAAAVTAPHPSGQNAQAVQMGAIFWIETVEKTIIVPPLRRGQTTVTVKPQLGGIRQPAPTYIVRPPIPITEPRPIKVTWTQIQYSQTVLLNFNGLTWPHISVATLVPSGQLTVPPSVWE